MLAEFVEKIASYVRAGNRIQTVDHPKLPRTVFMHDGSALTERAVPPADRNYTVDTLDSLVDMLLAPSIAKAPIVFVSAAYIVALFDREDRRERVTLRPVLSERMSVALAWEKEGGFDAAPKQAIAVLQNEFHGGMHAHVIDALRDLEFVTTDVASSTAKRGDERMARSHEGKVNAVQTVPPTFDLVVPVWSTPGLSQWNGAVRVNLDFDIEKANVSFRVLSDECKRVTDTALLAVHNELRERLGEGIPVFLGLP